MGHDLKVELGLKEFELGFDIIWNTEKEQRGTGIAKNTRVLGEHRQVSGWGGRRVLVVLGPVLWMLTLK